MTEKPVVLNGWEFGKVGGKLGGMDLFGLKPSASRCFCFLFSTLAGQKWGWGAGIGVFDGENGGEVEMFCVRGQNRTDVARGGAGRGAGSDE